VVSAQQDKEISSDNINWNDLA